MLSCPYSVSRFGGVQAQVLGLARALRALGVDARVIAPCDGPPPEAGVITVGPSTRLPSNGSVAPVTAGRAPARRTLEAVRSFRPDVVHLHEPLAPGANHALLVGTELPAVGTFHSARPGRNGWYETLRSPLRPMFRRLAVRTAVSAEAERQVVLSFGGSCEIVPNGVDLTGYEMAPTLEARRPSVFFVGRHEPRKGLDVLLRAFAGLGHEATLWIAGEGPQTAELRGRRVAHVEWLGTISETEKVARLRAATVACFPAIDGESFGVVLLEAMAACTPVVASDITGYRDVARDGREALLVPPGDVDGLRAALGALLEDPARRATLSALGRARAEEFSMEHVAQRFVEVYERAMGRTV